MPPRLHPPPESDVWFRPGQQRNAQSRLLSLRRQPASARWRGRCRGLRRSQPRPYPAGDRLGDYLEQLLISWSHHIMANIKRKTRLRRQTRALPSPDDYCSAQDGAYQQVKQCPKPCRECCRSTERSTHVMVRCSNRPRLVIPIHVRGCEEDKRGHQKGHGLMPRPSVGYIADALRQDKDHGRKDNDSSRFDKFHFSGPICVKPFRRNHPAYKLAAVGRSPKVIRSVCPRPHQIRICSASE